MFSDAQKIAYVAQSPLLCGKHDREGWVGLFARDAQVNDPIGSRPHEGHAAIRRFYDTFIAPNALSFDVEKDFVGGAGGMTVVRDLHINTVMSTGVRISVPMHIRYVLTVEDGALRIHRLYAHWELNEMLRQQRSTLKGLWTSVLLTPRMLKYQGVGGVMGFMEGLNGIGDAGKRTAHAHLASNPAMVGWEPGKTLAAGNWVSMTVRKGAQRGVVVCRFDDGPDKVSTVETYFER